MAYNSENPYVLNPYFFASSPNSVIYEQTTIAFIQKSFHLFAFISGLISCLLSIYLIIFRTPGHIRKFSRILLLCAFSDVAYLVCVFGCQMVGFFE
jgi:hypothetical protein